MKMSDMDEDLEAVVIDNGTWMIKAGYAGGKTAQAYERTVIGIGETGVGGVDSSTQQTDAVTKLFGNQACLNRNCQLTFPMQRGSVCDWDNMENLWEHVFTHELRDGIEGRPFLITELPGNDPKNRRKMVEILMEKFQVPALYITDPASLSLVCSGRVTGVVLDIGGSTSHVTSIYNGSLLKCHDVDKAGVTTCVRRSDIGGHDVTSYLSEIVGKKLNRTFESNGHAMLDIESLKHCLYNYTVAGEKNMDYSFPDGTSVTVNNDMINCGDILFHPEKIGSEELSVDKLLLEALRDCEEVIKKELLSNIILSGGTTLTPGVVERVQACMKEEFTEYNDTIKVFAPPERRKSSWMGGAIIASLEIFPQICKTKQDYTEKGFMDFTHFAGLEFLTTL